MITVKVVGMDVAIAMLNRLGHIETRELLGHLVAITKRQIDDHFTSGSGPDGKWAALSPATISINSRRAGGTPLSDTGLLKGTIQDFIGGDIARIWPQQKYGVYHQNGATLNMFGRGVRAKLPQRKFLGWDAGELGELEKAVNMFIADQIK